MNAPQGGLFESLKSFASTVLEVAHTRLELFSTELFEERVRLGLLMTYAVTAVILLSLGLILLVTTLAVIFWDQRIVLFVVTTLIFLGGGTTAAVMAIRQINARSRLFSASLAELAKDRVALSVPPASADGRSQ